MHMRWWTPWVHGYPPYIDKEGITKTLQKGWTTSDSFKPFQGGTQYGKTTEHIWWTKKICNLWDISQNQRVIICWISKEKPTTCSELKHFSHKVPHDQIILKSLLEN